MSIFLGAVDKSIQLESVNYLGDTHDKNSPVYRQKWNTKVLYRKNGKLYLGYVYIDFFNRNIYSYKQPEGGKVLKNLKETIKVNYFNW